MRRTVLSFAAAGVLFVTVALAQQPVLRLTATSVNVSEPGNNVRIDLTRWSTDQERNQLVTALTPPAPAPAAVPAPPTAAAPAAGAEAAAHPRRTRRRLVEAQQEREAAAHEGGVAVMLVPSIRSRRSRQPSIGGPRSATSGRMKLPDTRSSTHCGCRPQTEVTASSWQPTDGLERTRCHGRRRQQLLPRMNSLWLKSACAPEDREKQRPL